MDTNEFLRTVFSFENYGEILPLVSNSIVAGAVLGLVGGLIGVFIMMRDMAFAVHGIAELSFAGAAFALLIGANVVFGSIAGSIVASLVLGLLGASAKDRNSIIGVMMPFGLGLGILCLALYEGRSANKFGLLTGQIVAVDDVQLGLLVVCAVVVVAGLVAIWRPLTFVSADPVVAAARGVPAGRLSVAFMLLLGLAVALSIQIVGALLVLSLLVTPAAAALRVTARPALTVFLSISFAMTSVVGGIMLALAGRLPISPYVTTISFLIYAICRVIAWRRHATRREHIATASPTAA